MTGYVDPSQIDSVGTDDISQILGLGANDSQQNRLALQMKLANALRTQNPSGGQVVPMGSTFIPPSPLTTAMETFDHLQGIIAQAQGKKDGAQLDADRQKGLMTFAKHWFKNGQGQQQGDPNDPNNSQAVGPSTASGNMSDPADETVPQQ
jgi:hypothetical protein